jgi:hypothetical protein
MIARTPKEQPPRKLSGITDRGEMGLWKVGGMVFDMCASPKM